MADQSIQQRLAAVLAADVVGYTRLMEQDAEGTVAAWQSVRDDVINPMVAEYSGRIVKLTGDGFLAEFLTVHEAVNCGITMQEGFAESSLEFRIGINLGDIIDDGQDIHGEGVNVAARIEALADPGGISISGSVYEQVRNRIEATYEDRGEQRVKNVSAAVRVYAIRLGEFSAGTTPADFVVADKPSIAVLPFDNMSDDPEQEFFADGLVEDITTTLSKLSGLSVIARNSTFVYKGRSIDVRQVAQELGVNYVLEGSVRKVGDRMRITAQLIEAREGTHLWAERFDRDVDDIFAVQDEITLVLATEMQIKLTEGEQARIRYTTTNNVAAWTHWAEGMAHFRQAVTKDTFGSARFCWEKALALDPESAVLNALLGFTHYGDARFGWWNDRKTALKTGHDYVDRALELDPDCPDAHSTSGMLLMVQGRYDSAVAAARKAITLAPGSADTATWACFVFIAADLFDEATAQIEKAIALSPNAPPAYLGHLGNVYRLSGRTDEAVEIFRALHHRAPGFGLADLVIAYSEKGQLELAENTALELLAVRPNFTVASWLDTQFRNNKARLEADVAALRNAGLPPT